MNERSNEIGYEFPPGRSQSLFWSLPPAFTGNRVSNRPRTGEQLASNEIAC